MLFTSFTDKFQMFAHLIMYTIHSTLNYDDFKAAGSSKIFSNKHNYFIDITKYIICKISDKQNDI